MRRRELWFAILAVASVIGVPVAVGWALGDDSATSDERSPITWSGPVRVVEGAPLVSAMVGIAPRSTGSAGDIALWGWEERSADAEIQWVDITGVAFHHPGQLATWYVDLAMYPPKTATLDRERTLISYGMVLDTDADGEADYELGISNDAPRPGELRLWITNLATGVTDEHVGRPNGEPFEEWHPDQRFSEELTRQPRFTLPISDLPGVDPSTVRFYAWSSVTDGPEVLAWDYAPDAGWLSLNPGPTP